MNLSKPVKMLYQFRIYSYILLSVFFLSCGLGSEKKKEYRNVSLLIDYSEENSRSFSKINEDLLMGVGTEAIYLVVDTVVFESNYQNLSSHEDRALTDTTKNKVTLTLPLDTTLKIYAYRFTENFTLTDLDSLARSPVSYGKSGSFIVSESAKSLKIKLTITPNGTPGLDVVTPSVSINNQGGSASITVKLDTQPKEVVTVPITIDNTSIATLGSTSISFTPLNWSTSQAVTLTGDNNTNYSDNVTLTTTLGPTTSEDSSYSGLIYSFILSSTGYPQTPDNLTATPDNGSVNLDWNPTASATGYNVYWDNVSGVDRNDNMTVGITTDNYKVDNLTNGTIYYFKVESLNSNGVSALSNEVSATPTPDNISNGLVAFYRFNGNANDNTSNAHHGTVSGATLTSGKDNVSNTAYSFDGTNDYIEYPIGLLSGAGEFSISLWINTSSSTESRIIQQRDANGYNGQYMLDLTSNGKLKVLTYKYGYKWGGTTNSTINDSNWHHVCFVQKDNGGTLYLDGSLKFTDNSSGKVELLFSTKTYVGGDKRNNNRFFNGKVDELRIYNRALTSTEISSL